MKRKSDNSKGVTLIALVTTIIVLLILASIATYSGINVINSSKLTTFTTEMKIMQTEVNNLYNQWKNGEIAIDETTGNITNTADNSTIGKDLTYNSDVEDQANYVLVEVLSLGDNLSSLTGYKYFDQETIQNLGIEPVKGEFFINIKTRNVVSYDGIEYDGEWYYTLEQLPDGLYNVDYDPQQGLQPTFDVSYERIGENKWRVTVSNIQYDGYIDKWTVQYQEDGVNYWNSTEDMSFVVNSRGWYNFYIENGDVQSEIKNEYIGNSAEINDTYWRKTSDKDSEWYIYSDTANENARVDVNEPKLTGYMAPIKYVGSDSGEQTGSKWANAITQDGSMWVWIPRYAYKITSGYHTNSEMGGTIQVAFIDINNNFLNGESGTIVTNPEDVTYTDDGTGNLVQNEWLVHPAFTSSAENGGGFGELTGLWVGKFETTGNYDSSTETGILSIKPATSSLTNMTINEQYKFALSGTYGEPVEVNSHMAKNSEWGAVAYLGQSKYGANGQKVQRNTNKAVTGGSNTESIIYGANKTQSTTYNAYGVYDMSGGVWERVASYVDYGDNMSSSNTTNGGYGEKGSLLGADSTERATSTAYKTVYTASGTSTINSYNLLAKEGTIKKGDAIWETSSYVTTGSWFGENAIFPHTIGPFFIRGGRYDESNAGVFYFNNAIGNAYSDNSFRLVLVF